MTPVRVTSHPRNWRVHGPHYALGRVLKSHCEQHWTLWWTLEIHLPHWDGQMNTLESFIVRKKVKPFIHNNVHMGYFVFFFKLCSSKSLMLYFFLNSSLILSYNYFSHSKSKIHKSKENDTINSQCSITWLLLLSTHGQFWPICISTSAWRESWTLYLRISQFLILKIRLLSFLNL